MSAMNLHDHASCAAATQSPDAHVVGVAAAPWLLSYRRSTWLEGKEKLYPLKVNGGSAENQIAPLPCNDGNSGEDLLFVNSDESTWHLSQTCMAGTSVCALPWQGDQHPSKLSRGEFTCMHDLPARLPRLNSCYP